MFKVHYIYDESKAAEAANRLAGERGYDGFASIDDPILRMWIWTKARENIQKKKYFCTCTISEFSCLILLSLIIGFLIGILV